MTDQVRYEVPAGVRVLILKPSKPISRRAAEELLQNIERMAEQAKELDQPLVLLVDPDWEVTVA